MMPISLAQAARAVRGTLKSLNPAAGQRTFGAVNTDSRSLGADDLFVALRGERFDGHAFVMAAQDHGMVAAIVDEAGDNALGDASVVRIVVPDTLVALGDLALWVRRRLGRPVAAITGSNGKTTTKELLSQALGLGGLVHKTPGNLNNLVGLPLTVFAWPDNAWTAVLEMGMNAPGEIARLTEVAEPQVGVITCVAAAHLQGLGSLQRVAAAKLELFAGLPQGAPAIINGDDAILCAAAEPHLRGRPTTRFGTGADADVRLVSANHVPLGDQIGLEVTLRMAGKTFSAVLPLVGRHNGMNAAGAVACAAALGIDAAQALGAMAQVRLPGARGRVRWAAKHQLHVLDDCYNANPHSMAAALTTLEDLRGAGATVAVLGDMLELGDASGEHHRQLGHAAVQAHADRIIAVGAFASDIVLGAREAGGNAQAVANVDQALQAVLCAASAGSWVLVKGSRGMRLERLVDALLAQDSSPASLA